MNKTWDKIERRFISTPDKMKSFFNDVEKLCRRYDLSIAHEDGNGGFLIEEYSQQNIEWLRDASKNYKDKQ